MTAFQKEVKSHNITPPPRCGLEFSNGNIIAWEKLLIGAFFVSAILILLSILVLLNLKIKLSKKKNNDGLWDSRQKYFVLEKTVVLNSI